MRSGGFWRLVRILSHAVLLRGDGGLVFFSLTLLKMLLVPRVQNMSLLEECVGTSDPTSLICGISSDVSVLYPR